jgi:tetratricopeptide (TPR) repeat protein
LQRFHNEARAAACLHHEHIVPVYGVGQERGVHYYAMQFIDGQTLAALIGERRQLAGLGSAEPPPGEPTGPYTPAGPADTPPPAGAASPTERSGPEPAYFRAVARFGVQAAEALEYAHALGVVHRDVKPANLMVDATGRLWVTDFGLARTAADSGLTLTGDLVGTLRYMSPEQALAQRVVIDHRTDVYSLGATLYELLTLRPAFDGETRQELLRQIAFEEPRRPRKLNKAIPGDLETIVLKAMEKNPQDRYATAQELADDLGRFLKDEPIRARRPTVVQRMRRWARRHRPVVLTAAAALVLMALVLTGSAVRGARGKAARRAETDRAVTTAVTQAETLLAEGDKQTDHPERWLATARLAEKAVERAEELLATGEATEELQGRVRQVREALDDAVTHSALLVELDCIQLEKTALKDGDWEVARAAPRYAAVFRSYGVDPAAPEQAAERVRGSRLREALVAALEDWCRVTGDATEKQRLRALLGAVEPAPDTFRRRWWAAETRGDGAALAQMAAEPGVQGLPVSAVLNMERTLRGKKEWAAAERLLRAYQERYPSNFWLTHDLGMVLLEQKPRRPEEAVRYLAAALSLRSDSAGVNLGLGAALYLKGDPDGAIRRFQAALRIDPNLAKAHSNLGAALKDKGKLDEAIECYRKAIEINPRDAKAHANLGLALYDKKDVEGAIRCYRAAIAIAPRFAKAHNNLGWTLYRTGDRKEAIRCYRAALAIDKDYAKAHYNLGMALSDQGNIKDAVCEFRAALKGDNKYAPAHFQLGRALSARGERQGAISCYQTAIQLDANFAEAYCNLAQELRDQGLFTESLAALKTGHELGERHRAGWAYPSAAWLRKAEKLVQLDAKLSQFLAGGCSPADPMERLQLAWLCQQPYKQLNAAAARLFSEAFADKPTLADDLGIGRRYFAARTACQAGCGRDKYGGMIDKEERARLRRQALDWLKADLAAWRQVLEDGGAEAGPVVTRQMQRWQQDPGFVGVRAPDALGKLPEGEQKLWQALWREVGQTLDSARGQSAPEE